jgi:hypothetical protein
MQTVTGFMPTDRPARYAKQLTSHWAKQGPVIEEDGAIVQRWDSGQVIKMTPADGGLAVEVGVPDEDPARFADVVKRHLERFGQRDELELVWTDDTAS